MIIRWHDGSFLAEFAAGDQWQSDLEAAKSAGLKTTGPPSWLWTTQKVKPLLWLRKHRPASRLEITNEALEKFQILFGLYEKNEVVLAEIKKAKKQKTKTEQKESKQAELIEIVIPEKGYLETNDLPSASFVWDWKRPEPPKERCLQCDDPLYAVLDYLDQAMCYYCYFATDCY